MISPGPEDAGRESGLEPLIAALGDKSWRVRKRALDALARQVAPDIVDQVLCTFHEQYRDLSRLNAAIQILTVIPADVVPALIQLLQTGNPDVRGYSALALGQRGDPRAIPALSAALADVDTNVRVQAIEALGALQAAAAVDRLVELVESDDFELAFPALDALRHIGDGRVAYRLVPLLENAILSEPAIEALGQLGDEEVVPILLELLSRQAARLDVISGAIVRIHNRMADLYECGSEAEELVRSFSKQFPIAPLLHRAILESPTKDRAALLTIYSWLSDNEVDQTLVNLLDLPELHDQCVDLFMQRKRTAEPLLLQRLERLTCAVEPTFVALLGKIGNPHSVPALLPLLTCEEETLIAAALESLARIRDERSYLPAKELLGHPNLMVRDGAVAVLNSLGHADLATDLQLLLRDPQPLVRESAVKVASYLGFANCLDMVLKLCSDPAVSVRQAAIAHLPCLDDSRVPANLARAVTADMPRVRATAAGALAAVGGQQAVSVLLQALEDPDAWVRYSAVQSLAKLDEQRLSGDRLLSIATSDFAMQVRIAAAGALGNYGISALPVLCELSRHENEDLAQAALSALGNLQQAESIPILTNALDASQPRLQRAAVQALGASRQANAVKVLQPIAVARDEELAVEAIAALGVLGTSESHNALLSLAAFPRKRKAAIEALLMARPTDVRTLISQLPSLPLDVSRSLIAAFSKMRTRGAHKGLEAAVVDGRPAVRFAAMAALSHRKIKDGSMTFPVEGGP